MTALKLAFSPCPNDTFVFHALVHGLVPGAPSFDVTYADVDVTNTAAEKGEFDLVKVSYAALPWLRSRPPRILEGHGVIAERAPVLRRLNVTILDRAGVQANT